NMVDRMRQMKFPKHTKLWTIIGVVILLIVVLGITAFDFVTEYIWMDSLSFGGIYTKILYTKLFLAVSGFVLFFILTFITAYFIYYFIFCSVWLCVVFYFNVYHCIFYSS